MNEVRGATYTSSTVEVDDNHFIECTFEKCHLVYKGLGPVQFTTCKLEECVWAFDGPAANTLSFLGSMSDAGSGMQGVLTAILNDLKTGVIRRLELPK